MFHVGGAAQEISASMLYINDKRKGASEMIPYRPEYPALHRGRYIGKERHAAGEMSGWGAAISGPQGTEISWEQPCFRTISGVQPQSLWFQEKNYLL